MSKVAIIHALKALLTRSNEPTTPNQSSDHSDTASNKLKAQDLLAFRTIITMLSYLQSSNAEPTTGIGPTPSQHQELCVLDALSAVLVRQHEIVAVVAKPYNGSHIQQISADSGDQGLCSKILNFIATLNPRKDAINGQEDSLMNFTTLPIIVDPSIKVPKPLITAAQEDKPLLNLFLQHYWQVVKGKESFDTHVWMLTYLLGRFETFTEDGTCMLYVIAESFGKMRIRMKNPRYSKPYLSCFLELKSFPFIEQSPVPTRGDDRSHDGLFLSAIPVLAEVALTKIPNLKNAAESKQPREIYNKDTYMEFHLLLCELLQSYSRCLDELYDLQSKEGRKLEEILPALQNIYVFGHYLRSMVRSAAIGKHLQVIAPFLVVDDRKSWTGRQEDRDEHDEQGEQDEEFIALKPYSMHKGKPLLPWQSYRDWLRLMTLYFDAEQILVGYVGSLECKAPINSSNQSPVDASNQPPLNQRPIIRSALPISIMILSPPCPNGEMLNWRSVMENERYFPQPSGKELAAFLTSKADVVSHKKAVDNVIKALRRFKGSQESGSSDDFELLTQQLICLPGGEGGDPDVTTVETLEMLDTLSKRASFYSSLEHGPLRNGNSFSGKQHCEAFIAALLALLLQSVQQVNKLEARLKELSEKEVNEFKALLQKFENYRHTIGVSKRCCTICACLLQLLNKRYRTNFVISDEHTTITPCSLSEWLPEDIVYSMVVEFGGRLRVELAKLQAGTTQLRARAGTADTGRISLDNARPLRPDGVVAHYATLAFSSLKSS